MGIEKCVKGGGRFWVEVLLVKVCKSSSVDSSRIKRRIEQMFRRDGDCWGSREIVFQGQKRRFSFEDWTYNILDIVCPEYSGHLDNAGQCLKYSIFE